MERALAAVVDTPATASQITVEPTVVTSGIQKKTQLLFRNMRFRSGGRGARGWGRLFSIKETLPAHHELRMKAR